MQIRLLDVGGREEGLTLTLSRRGLHGGVRATFRGIELLHGFILFGASPSACISAGKLGNLCAPF